MISWSTELRQTRHLGFITFSSNDSSKIWLGICFTLSIFHINQHSRQVCWCWHGNNNIDFFRPHLTMHSMLSCCKICSPFWFSMFFKSDWIFCRAVPLRVTLPKCSILSESSSLVVFFFWFDAVFFCLRACSRKGSVYQCMSSIKRNIKNTSQSYLYLSFV